MTELKPCILRLLLNDNSTLYILILHTSLYLFQNLRTGNSLLDFRYIFLTAPTQTMNLFAIIDFRTAQTLLPQSCLFSARW